MLKALNEALTPSSISSASQELGAMVTVVPLVSDLDVPYSASGNHA